MRNSINRTNVVKVPIDSFDANDDFFKLVIEAHIIAAAMEKFNMATLQSSVSEEFAPEGENSWMLPLEERKQLFDSLLAELTTSFFTVDFNNAISSSDSKDMVNQYAVKMLNLGLFYYEYGDAIKEGDGSRIFRCLRYLLPMFLSSGRRNYAIETMHTLLKHDYLLSPREANELLWGRSINVHGLPGRNIPNDLHNEHLNRACKTPLKNLGPNKTAQCITRIGRAIGTNGSCIGPV